MGILYKLFEIKYSKNNKTQFINFIDKIIDKRLTYTKIYNYCFGYYNGKKVISQFRINMYKDICKIFKEIKKDMKSYLNLFTVYSLTTKTSIINHLKIVYLNVMLFYDPFIELNRYKKIIETELLKKGYDVVNSKNKHKYIRPYKIFRDLYIDTLKIDNLDKFIKRVMKNDSK